MVNSSVSEDEGLQRMYNDYVTSAYITIVFCDVIMAITIVIGIIGNTSICVCVLKTRSLRTYMNVNLVSSCVANILGCTCLLPVRMVLYSGHPELVSISTMCKFGTFIETLCDIIQFIMLTTASFERYQAVVNPFKKDGRKKRTAIFVSVAWITALVLSAFSAEFFIDSSLYVPCTFLHGSPKWSDHDKYMILPLGVFSFFAIVLSYVCIMYTLVKHSLTMARHIKKSNNKVSPSPSDANDNVGRANISIINPFVRNDKSSLTKSQDLRSSCTNPQQITVSSIASNGNENNANTTANSSETKTSKDFSSKRDESISTNIADPSLASQRKLGTPKEETTTYSSQNRLTVPTQSSTNSCITPNDNTVQVVAMDGSVQLARTHDDSIQGAICVMNSKNRVQGRRRVEVKAAKKIGILIGSFVCCWMPLPLFVISCGTYDLSVTYFRILLLLGTVGATTLAVNPILYAIINKPLHSSLKSILKPKRCGCLNK